MLFELLVVLVLVVLAGRIWNLERAQDRMVCLLAQAAPALAVDMRFDQLAEIASIQQAASVYRA